MDNRRGFLGSVIGTFVASRLPFVAEPVPNIKLSSKLQFVKDYVTVFEASKTKLLAYRMYAVTDRGERFFAPAIKDVVVDREILKAIFWCEDIHIRKSLNMKAAGLLTPEGRSLRELMFVANTQMITGDVLKISYSLEIPLVFP